MRCGCSLCARQIRWTELMLIPTSLAMAAAVQWVASPGGSALVRSTTWSITGCARAGIRDGRVLSRNKPPTPAYINRSCQRQTDGFDLPVRRMISAVPRPSAVIRMIDARQTCFCTLFRSATIAAKRARSDELTSIWIPFRMIPGSHRRFQKGILCQIHQQGESTCLPFPLSCGDPTRDRSRSHDPKETTRVARTAALPAISGTRRITVSKAKPASDLQQNLQRNLWIFTCVSPGIL